MSTIAEKAEKLRERQDAEKSIQQRIDRLVDNATDDDVQRCGFCHIFGRRRRNEALRRAIEQGPSSSTGAEMTETKSKIFSIGRKKASDPALKLKEAASALQERIEQLETRAQESRADAASAMRANKKMQAMRALKKAKALEKQASSNQSSLDALEAQLSLLEQAAVQRQLASALASSSKQFKGTKKLLSVAENAIDDAADARDLAVELGDVMAEFGSNGAVEDDDDLMAELNAMVASAEIPEAENDEMARQAQRDLERRQQQYAEAEEARRQMPAAPSNRVERQRLIE